MIYLTAKFPEKRSAKFKFDEASRSIFKLSEISKTYELLCVIDGEIAVNETYNHLKKMIKKHVAENYFTEDSQFRIKYVWDDEIEPTS